MVSETTEFIFFQPDSSFSQNSFLQELLSGNTAFQNIRIGMGMTPTDFFTDYRHPQADGYFTIIGP